MENPRILFLSTYPPRACGIATFTQDLLGALRNTGQCDPGVVAIDNGNAEPYPPEVKFTLEQQDRDAYPKTAAHISAAADLLMIEHEFGIYGGKSGEFLLDLTKHLKIPYLVTLHTVLPKPTKKQRDIIAALARGCRKLVTMSAFSVPMLRDVYGADVEKIAVIPHGVPEIAVPGRDELKRSEGLSGRFVVSTFGLLSPGKGLEYGIGAVAHLAKKHPEMIYLILGQTHPVIKSRYGERYREKLEKRAADLGASENIRFVNRYLTKEEIIRYLTLSDVYMTPYLGKDQAVSGTLAYAAGCGRVIVSTPYPYAREMLAGGRGLLAEFRRTTPLAACLLEILTHPHEKEKMEMRMLNLGKTMMWSRVAEKYLAAFGEASEAKEETSQ